MKLYKIKVLCIIILGIVLISCTFLVKILSSLVPVVHDFPVWPDEDFILQTAMNKLTYTTAYGTQIGYDISLFAYTWSDAVIYWASQV